MFNKIEDTLVQFWPKQIINILAELFLVLNAPLIKSLSALPPSSSHML